MSDALIKLLFSIGVTVFTSVCVYVLARNEWIKRTRHNWAQAGVTAIVSHDAMLLRYFWIWSAQTFERMKN